MGDGLSERAYRVPPNACRMEAVIRAAVLPSQNSGLAGVRSVFSNVACTAVSKSSGVTSRFVPCSMVIGRSVLGRRVKQGKIVPRFKCPGARENRF